jgi:hypothetical protein
MLFKFINVMPKKITFFHLLFFIVPLITIAQNDSVVSAETKTTLPDIEKVYLHTDRNYYTVGESLWYKAYSVYAYNNVPFDNSKILYVELIAPESKIIARNVTQLEEGLGHGDFVLSDSIGVKPGTYQLRAYTNWMRNFGDDFVYQKEIQIISPGKEPLDASNQNSPMASTNKKDNASTDGEIKKSFDIQFFPEGGSLLENVPGYVAFKAIDPNGNPIEVEGTIFDTNGKIISLLKSRHDGMGKFKITPEKDQHYSAEITASNNQQIKVALPVAEKTGYALSMNVLKDKKVMTITTNQETLAKNPEAALTLICSTRGISYFEGVQTLNQTKLSFLLPEDDFPEGIAQITLYDDNAKPLSERLIYIEKNNDVDVTISADKPNYLPKEKVNLEIVAKNKQGTPIIASFSLAATDANGSNNSQDKGINICSYFLMASDIKGKVYNPGYYFDSSQPERLPNLDLLLLTQGWRDFIWKKKPALKENPDFRAEKGIKISGTVKKLFGDSPKENCQVRMILINKGKTMMLNDTTQVDGKFKFDKIVFKGKTTLMLNAQNEKGKNGGLFVLDSLYNEPIAINYKANEPINAEKLEIDKLKENIHHKNILFNGNGENILDEVTIKAKKKVKTENSKYGFADYTYVPEEKGPRFSSIFTLIQFSIPGITVSGNSVRFNKFNGPALILIDGAEVEMDELQTVATDDVAKIEAINTARAAIFGSNGGNGAILVYTKEGSLRSKKINVFHSITMGINGYQEARFFYAPKYETISNATDVPDIRNTLYWNPYIQPDEKGNAEISYYNSEANTNVNVTLEGITSNGIPIVVKTNYGIKK